MVDEELEPLKDPVIEKIGDEVNSEIERDEKAVEQVEKRAREAKRKYEAGNRWPDP